MSSSDHQPRRWLGRSNRAHTVDAAPASDGGVPTAGEVLWWDLESSEKRHELTSSAFKAGRKMSEPERPAVPAPACFIEAVAWVTELGGSRVQAFHADHRSDVTYIVANNHLVHYYGELNPDLIAAGVSRETAQRRAAADLEVAKEIRAKFAGYRSDEAVLDYELSRLVEAWRRLDAAMRAEFIRAWHWRDDIDMIVFPHLDPTGWRYSGYSGINVGDVVGPLPMPPQTLSPESLMPPEPKLHELPQSMLEPKFDQSEDR